MLEGVIAILEGMNPRMVELKLRTFLAEQSEEHAIAPEGTWT
jgi:chemotaxis protein MotA